MSNETPADVLAEMRQAAVQAIGPVGKMMGGTIALWADRIERSLAAGKVATVPSPEQIAAWATGWRASDELDEPLSAEDQMIWRISYAVHCGMRDTAPPADPAKADSPPFMRGKYRAAMEAEAAACIVDRDPAKASEPEYDRSLIADMLEDAFDAVAGLPRYSTEAIGEQIRLLRAADNTDGIATARTAKASGSAPDGWRIERKTDEVILLTPPGGITYEVHTFGSLLYSLCDALLATPPASAPEVTEEMVQRALEAYWCSAGGVRAALAAALQQEGKSHDQ